jgi:hypothetical protein
VDWRGREDGEACQRVTEIERLLVVGMASFRYQSVRCSRTIWRSCVAV